MCIYSFHSSKQAALLTPQQTELSRLQCLARTNCPSPAHIGGALLLKIHIHCFCRGYSQSGQAAHELCVALFTQSKQASCSCIHSQRVTSPAGDGWV